MIKNFTPADGETVSLTNDRVRLFYMMRSAQSVVTDELVHPWTGVAIDKDGSHPKPVLLSWNTDIQWNKFNFAVHISRSGDFTDEIVIDVPEEGNAIDVYNLEIGQKYYWYVENRAETAEMSEVTTFYTADEFPRSIYIDPLNTNIRDAGGLYNIDGRRVKQGLLYRGASIDFERTPSDEGFRRLTVDLGVRTDIDLRGIDFKEAPPPRDPRFESVGYVLLQLRGYAVSIENEINYPTIRRLFEILCDERSYPAYMHCISGIDRTGTAMFLLGLALRIDVERLIIDYELSALCHDGYGWNDRSRLNIDQMILLLEKNFGKSGDDIYTRAEIYFDKAIGLPDAPEKLRRIFLE